MTGPFTTTQVVTKGAKNTCPGDILADPWPGGSAVERRGRAQHLLVQPERPHLPGSRHNAPGTLWAVRNGSPEALYKLVKNGSDWVPDTGDWAAGKQLRYPDGTGNPDAEGVTFTDAGPAGGAFVSTERNNANSSVSRPAILRFDPNASGTTLTATNDWNLTADLPGLGANLGLEGIAWVPDGYLVTQRLQDARRHDLQPGGLPEPRQRPVLRRRRERRHGLRLRARPDRQQLHPGRELRERVPGGHGGALREGDAAALGRLRRHLPGPQCALRRRHAAGPTTARSCRGLLRASVGHGQPQQRRIHDHRACRVCGRPEAGLLVRRRQHGRQLAASRAP